MIYSVHPRECGAVKTCTLADVAGWRAEGLTLSVIGEVVTVWFGPHQRGAGACGMAWFSLWDGWEAPPEGCSLYRKVRLPVAA